MLQRSLLGHAKLVTYSVGVHGPHKLLEGTLVFRSHFQYVCKNQECLLVASVGHSDATQRRPPGLSNEASQKPGKEFKEQIS